MVVANWPIRARDLLLLCYNACSNSSLRTEIQGGAWVRAWKVIGINSSGPKIWRLCFTLPEIGAGSPLILDLSAGALTDKGFDLSAWCHGGSVKILSNNECFRKYLVIYRIYPWLRFLWKSKQIKYLLCFSFQLKTLNILNLLLYLLYPPFPVRLVILNGQ